MTDKPSAYVPQAGTMAHSCLMAMAKRGEDRYSTVELLEIIGQPSDYSGLSGVLEACLKHGLIDKEKKDGDARYVRWFLTDLGRRTAHWVNSTAGQAEPEPALKPAIGPVALPPVFDGAEVGDAPASDCEFALTSAGRLLIEVDGQKLALTETHTNELLGYLDAQRGVTWGSEA